MGEIKPEPGAFIAILFLIVVVIASSLFMLKHYFKDFDNNAPTQLNEIANNQKNISKIFQTLNLKQNASARLSVKDSILMSGNIILSEKELHNIDETNPPSLIPFPDMKDGVNAALEITPRTTLLDNMSITYESKVFHSPDKRKFWIVSSTLEFYAQDTKVSKKHDKQKFPKFTIITFKKDVNKPVFVIVNAINKIGSPIDIKPREDCPINKQYVLLDPKVNAHISMVDNLFKITLVDSLHDDFLVASVLCGSKGM